MRLVVHGLGRMGMQIARKLAKGGHTVYAHNRSQAPMDEAIGYGCIAVQTKQDAVKAFGDEPGIVWVMLPAEISDAEIIEWSTLLAPGSTIINGANADFRDTAKLSKKLKDAGL